jgi:threonine/homoserine/homoserine lactone efflux protein
MLIAQTILQALLTGLAYGCLLGPLFFLVLNTVLKKGFRHALALVAGAFFSDQILMWSSWLFSAQITTLVSSDWFRQGFGVAGGLILIAFGLPPFLLRQHDGGAGKLKLPGKDKYSLFFVQGFLLNLLNPSNWLFWIGLSATVVGGPNSDQLNTGVFLLTVALMMLLTDFAKLLIVNKLKKRISGELIRMISRGAGLILIGLGAWALIKTLLAA